MPVSRSLASWASSNDPRAASTAANRASPTDGLPTGRFNTASAGCRFPADGVDANTPDVGPVVMPVPSEAGPGWVSEAVGVDANTPDVGPVVMPVPSEAGPGWVSDAVGVDANTPDVGPVVMSVPSESGPGWVSEAVGEVVPVPTSPVPALAR